MGGLWPRTGRVLVVAGSLTFFALDVLVLQGSELALDLLISLTFLLAGLAFARLATRPFRKGSGNRKVLALFAGLASVFAIIFGGTALAGIPPYPTAEGGDVGNMIYGLALGFGVGVPGGLAPARSGVPAAGSETKVVAVVLGTVVALFSLLLVLYLLLEYAVVPLIRTLAA